MPALNRLGLQPRFPSPPTMGDRCYRMMRVVGLGRGRFLVLGVAASFAVAQLFAGPSPAFAAGTGSGIPALCAKVPASTVSAVLGIKGMTLRSGSTQPAPGAPFTGTSTICQYWDSNASLNADGVELAVIGVDAATAGSRSSQISEVKGQYPGWKLASFGTVPSLGHEAYSFTFTKKHPFVGYEAGVQDFRSRSMYEAVGGTALTRAKAVKLVKLMLTAV